MVFDRREKIIAMLNRDGMVNAVRPGKTPLPSMSPTIVLHGQEPVLAAGSAGGGVLTEDKTTAIDGLCFE